MTDAAPADVTGGERISPRLLIGFMAMVMGLFLAVLDIMIVASSLGEIQTGLSASVDEISWIQTSFLIAESIAILITGWLVGIFSTRWLYTAAAIGFTLMSAACAGAWDIWSMILFRSLQGLFAGMMIPTVFSAVYKVMPIRSRATGLVLTSLVATLAPAVGPSLGGWITESFSWHWLFLINVGPGLLVAATVWHFVDYDLPNLEFLRKVDWLGLGLIFVAMSAIIYVLEEAPGEDWFESQSITVLTVTTALAFIALIWRQLSVTQPIIELRGFRNRNFSIGCLYSFLFGAGLFGSLFLVPLFLFAVRDFNALQVGLVMMVSGATQFIMGPIAGNLERKFPRRAILAFGLVVLAASLFANATLTSEAGFDQLFVPQVMRGIGIMFCFMPITAIALGRLRPEEVDNASAIYNVMRTLGGGVGIAILNTVVDARFDLHYLRIAETVRIGSSVSTRMLQGLGARLETILPGPEMAETASLKIIKSLAEKEAITMAFNDAFFILGVFFVFAVLLLPFLQSVTPRPAEPKPAEAEAEPAKA
jgi:DHA2 family multidrug resistance protein